MGLLDSDAEELKKGAKAAAESGKPSGTGRKVNQSGLGAFKGISKYSNLTAKYRTTAQGSGDGSSTAQAPSNSQGRSSSVDPALAIGTNNLSVEHGRGTLPELTARVANPPRENSHQTVIKIEPNSEIVENGYQSVIKPSNLLAETVTNTAQNERSITVTKRLSKNTKGADQPSNGYQSVTSADEVRSVDGGRQTVTKRLSGSSPFQPGTEEAGNGYQTVIKQSPTEAVSADKDQTPSEESVTNQSPNSYQTVIKALPNGDGETTAEIGDTLQVGVAPVVLADGSVTKRLPSPDKVPAETVPNPQSSAIQLPNGYQTVTGAFPLPDPTDGALLNTQAPSTGHSPHPEAPSDGPTLEEHIESPNPGRWAQENTDLPEALRNAPISEPAESPASSPPAQNSLQQLAEPVRNEDSAPAGGESVSSFSETATKRLPNGHQTVTNTVIEPGPNGHQTDTTPVRPAATGTKRLPNPLPRQLSNEHQSDTKQLPLVSFAELVGLQRNVTLFIFESCKQNRDRVSGPVALSNLALAVSSTTGAIKQATHRLRAKCVIWTAQQKDGRGGFTRYGLADSIYQEILLSESVTNRLSNSHQSAINRLPQPVSQRLSPDSSSSSFPLKKTIQEKTTTTVPPAPTDALSANSTPSAREHDPAWFTVDYSALHELQIFFGRTHIDQLISRSWCRTPSDLQDSLNHLAWKMKHDRGAIKDPLAHFMAAMRDGKYYPRPQGYESADERAERLKLQDEQEKALALERAIEQRFDAVFQQFFLTLNGHRIQLLAPNVSNYDAQKLIIRKRFRDELWVKAMDLSAEEVRALRFSDEHVLEPQPALSAEELKGAFADLDASSKEQVTLSSEQRTALASLPLLYGAWRQQVPRDLQMQVLEQSPNDAEGALKRHFEANVLPNQNPGLLKTLGTIPAEHRTVW